MPIMEIWCEETGTRVTVECGDEALTILSRSADLATLQDAHRFVRAWADAREQEQFDQALQPLKHVLAVIKLYGQGRGACTRLEATHRVAAEHEVDVTTIRDAYTRALGDRVDDFDRLLDNPLDLEDELFRQYPGYEDVIESYMFYLTRRPI